jgi:hypothetical protein
VEIPARQIAYLGMVLEIVQIYVFNVTANARPAADQQQHVQFAAIHHICSTLPAIPHVLILTMAMIMEQQVPTYAAFVTPSAPLAQAPQTITVVSVLPISLLVEQPACSAAFQDTAGP